MTNIMEHSVPSNHFAQRDGERNSGFFDELWEKKSALLTGHQTLELPKIEPGELFRAVVACTDDFCRTGRQRVRLYVDGLEVDVLGGGHQAILPKDEDRSFDEYNRRMIECSGFNDYALVVADWHQFDRSLWERILVSVEWLAEKVGISRSRMDTQVFLGTYKVTPFGVHADPTSAFHFPVIGTKIMRFWDGSFGTRTRALQKTHNYEPFLRDSTVIKARPGEVIYWPSDYWHVGESDGTFSVTWGFGYWIGDNARRRAIEKAMKVFGEIEPEPRITLPQNLVPASETSAAIDGLVRDLLRAVSSDTFRRLIVQSWLEHYSAYGFLSVPSLMERVQLGDHCFVRKKAAFRILYSQIGPGLVSVASAGYSCVLPAIPTIRLVIDRLNEGSAVAMKEFLGYDGNAASVVELIDFCMRSGALVAEDVS
jgi:hypothetical protein